MPYTFPVPSDPSHNEITNWMTFWAADYSLFSSNRTPDAIIEQSFNSITLPFPGVYNTQNTQEYSNTASPQIKAFELGVLGSLKESILGTIEKTESFLRGGNVMTFDHMETVLVPGGRRTHRFEFNLIAKTPDSAVEAAKIGLVFQTLMHPGFNTQSVYTQTHPAVWIFTAGQIQANYNNRYGYMDGNPLPSVLTSVDINRAPINNVPYMIAGAPIATNIKLTFLELEPAFHGASDQHLYCRSQR